jgi:hypothetical protein
MSKAISDRVKAVSPDNRQGKQLQFVPILGRSHKQPRYELLRAETLNFVEVTETSQSGSVPELQVVNKLDVRVFLMDGQELIGAKQNRILNTDVLVPAKSSVKIPVSCVERGRWRHVSQAFHGGKSASHRTRSAKLSRVHQNLKSAGRHDADQGAVWDEVAKSLKGSGASSPTSALSDAYAQRDVALREFRGSLKLPKGAVGVAVFQAGKFQGLDLFDRHSTLQYFWESLVDSYAIDLLEAAVDPAQPATDDGQIIRSVLDRAIAGKWDSFDPPGDGKEWRMDDHEFSAASLVWNEKVVLHLQVFPKAARVEEEKPVFRPRIRRRYEGD